ncbi:uncharacterized protein LOC128735557 [Sabethes cyaneus]|uniref:uncharacterized protein LOC128735557 n=1 Tax=Sabethes cyaneus TaxID=53552 RepID=UPI00237DEE55|nr:uncharacterized protein LOC128735557 [Sabethes cyaneus]
MNTVNYEENFKLFYRIAKVLILQLKDDDKVLAAQWLRKLAACQSDADSELRCHYMTLLLITLQQQRIVGPFKEPPVGGTKLEPFAEDYQPEDIQRLINDDLQKTPPPPLTQFALSGGPMLTEFAVAQEIPKFGAHFFYVCSLQPVYEFQQAYQSQIPRPLRGPTRSTMRDLNAGVERLLREERKKIKVTVDKSGKKSIQIKDEHFAAFSETARKPRAMSKRLQKRLGVTLPEPEPATADSFEEPSPRRPAGPAGSIAGAVAAGAASAVATSKLGTPGKPKSAKKSGIARPGIKPPGAVKSGTRLAAPGSVQRRPAPKAQPAASPEPQVIPVSSPLRFTRHPDAPPTPPLFLFGAPTGGQAYEQEAFDVPATEKFAVSKVKFLQKKWSPKKKPGRVDVLEILEEHPITEEILQLEAEARPRIPTPEIVEEVRETKRRSLLLKTVTDAKTRELMEKFYAVKTAKPRKLDFSQEIDATVPTVADQQQPVLLDDTAEFLAEEAMDYYQQFADSQYIMPEVTQDMSLMPGPSSTRLDLGREEEQFELLDEMPPWQEDLQGQLQQEPSGGALQDEFLADIDIEFAEEPIYDDSSLSILYESPARSPIDHTRRLQEARAAYQDVAASLQYRTPTPKRPPQPRRISPKDTADRLLDISGAATPRTPRMQQHMMDLITGETPPEMKIIMRKIADQVEVHKEIVAGIVPKSPSVERLRIDLSRGADALENLKSRLQQLREARQVQPKTPPKTPLAPVSIPETQPEVPFSPLGFQLLNVSEMIANAMENAQLLQDVAEAVPEPIVQEAANQSLQSAVVLGEISDRLKNLTTMWEQTVHDVDDASLGLIEDEEIGDDIFDMDGTLDSMVESLDKSVKEVIAEGDDVRSPAAQHLQTALRDFQRAFQEISLDLEGSLLESSTPADVLLNDALDDAVEVLEQSMQLEKAAVMNVSATKENQEVLKKSSAATEGLAEVLDQMVALAPPSPTQGPQIEPHRRADIESRLKTLRIASRQPVEEDVLVDIYGEEEETEPEFVPFKIDFSDDEGDEMILADEEMMTGDLLTEETEDAAKAFFSRPTRRPLPFSPSLLRKTYTPKGRHSEKRLHFQEQIQAEMANLLSVAEQQQLALLDASLTINDNAADASAIAASQRVAQSMLKSQAEMFDMISQVQQSPRDKAFGWLGPMASHGLPRKSGSKASLGAIPKASRSQVRMPARAKAPSRASAQPTPGRAAPSKPPAVRRPVKKSVTEGPLAPPPGVKVPKPRAGYDTPVPVKRPPQPIPLPGTSGAAPSTASTSVRASLPRPTSASSTSRRR